MLLSHSEAESFNMCERRHYYAFGERIQKRKLSTSLQRGNYGHSYMEVFFKALQQGNTWDYALAEVAAKYQSDLVENISDPDFCLVLQKLMPRVIGFLNHYRDRILRWKIVAVEQEFRLPIGDEDTYPFKIDLVMEENAQVKIVDWKFTYDFYLPDVVKLLPQIPKYIGALRSMGYSVSDGYYGFIRYRDLKEEDPKKIFDLHPVGATKSRILRSFHDYVVTLEQVRNMRKLPLEKWELSVRRAANNMICKNCGYLFLCQAELNGSDGKMIRRQDFVPNTYGYSEEVEV